MDRGLSAESSLDCEGDLCEKEAMTVISKAGVSRKTLKPAPVHCPLSILISSLAGSGKGGKQ